MISYYKQGLFLQLAQASRPVPVARYFLSFTATLTNPDCMRCCSFLLLLLTMIISCSKKNTARTNFAEITIAGNKFTFDSREAIFDTSRQEIACTIRLDDRASNSYMMWKTSSGSKWINGVYEYPGEYFPGRSVVFMHLHTYINRIPSTYAMQNNSFTLTIDQSKNGRMHGTISGKLFCLTCNPYGTEESIIGEFEMPYSYQ